MKRHWERLQIVRDRIEWFLGAANLFVWTVFTPILFLCLPAVLGGGRALVPSDSVRLRENLITAGQAASLAMIVPALMLLGFVFRVFQEYQDSGDFHADVRDPATGKPVPTTIVFTRHLPALPRAVGWPLAAWWGSAGVFFAWVNATRKGLTMQPRPDEPGGSIDPLSYAVYWIVGSTFVYGLSSALLLALAVKAATGSEARVVGFWRLRYWYCLGLSLFGYAVLAARWMK